MDGETTLFVGGHYEITNPGAGQTVTKYYMAGATRVAVRKGGTLSYLLADHLGSSSLSTDSAGNRTSELRYKPWGETRFSFGTMPTKYTFTGQFSYTDDPSTEEVTEGFGLMYYGARWYDPSLSRFAQADTIMPGGVQGMDRYAYTDNAPVRYTDPTGHSKSDCNPMLNPNCDIQAEDEKKQQENNNLDSNFCSGEPEHQSCTWEFTGSFEDDEKLIASFLEMLRTLDEDPFGKLSNAAGFVPGVPYPVSFLKRVLDTIRGNYYDKLDDFEENVSTKFESHQQQKLKINFTFTEEVNYTKDGKRASYVSGSLTVSAIGFRPRYRQEVELYEIEAYGVYQWFVDNFGR